MERKTKEKKKKKREYIARPANVKYLSHRYKMEECVESDEPNVRPHFAFRTNVLAKHKKPSTAIKRYLFN